MSLADELKDQINEIIGPDWSITDGLKIPSQDDIGLGTVGKRLELVVLYADIAGSTQLLRDYKDWFVASLAKAFLVCSVRIIRDHDGVITSFDGDRVMAVFHGDSKNSSAAKVALKINWAVKKIINVRVKSAYPKQSGFKLGHCVGIDRSDILVTRSGIRNNNDLVWIGRAANYAAKLSERRTESSTYITKDVYDFLNDDAKYGGNPKRNMWTAVTVDIAGQSTECYKSTWWWEP